MRSVATIPVKSRSTRMPGKNLAPFAGQPLFEHFFSKLDDHPFDEIVVDTDNDAVAAAALDRGWRHLVRPPELLADEATGNELLLHVASKVEADVYFQLFVTAPLLKSETIAAAHAKLLSSPDHDSIFTVVPIHSWFWFDGRPVNYDPHRLLPSQHNKPVIRETTGLYGIRADALEREQARIGTRPLMFEVDEVEAIDVDTELDFRLAEFLWKEGG